MSSENTKDSIKAINEFLIDIIGALVPGIIFLISTIVSLIFPLLILMYSQIPKSNDPVEKIDLLLLSVSRGWFWLVIFFILLIMAYAIGNIFYRLDIKKIDKISFSRAKNRCFREDIIPIINGLLDNDKLKLNRYKLSFIIKNLFFLKKVYKQSLGFDSFIDKYCLLLTDHLSKNDREYLQKEKQSFCALLKEHERSKIEDLNTIAYFVYRNKHKDLIIKGKIDVKECTGKEKELSKILCEFFSPYMKSKELRDFIKKGSEERKEIEKLLAIGWYFLFLLRSENACDNEQDCQFPYQHYDTYLIKREETHLLDHVEHWCKDERSRSKNALNRLKLKLQLIANQDYNILIKNEAHIRMSSSSWYVAGRNMLISGVVLFIMIILFIWKLDVSQNLYLITFPGMMLFLNLFIYRSVIKYLHYQRLMEIFFVLQVFDEYFGEGCIYRNTGIEEKDDISNRYRRKKDSGLF